MFCSKQSRAGSERERESKAKRCELSWENSEKNDKSFTDTAGLEAVVFFLDR